MPLTSNLLAEDKRLQSCLVSDPAHVKVGDQGKHVRLIQVALILIDEATIDQGEIDAQYYGRSTASAVLAYKKARNIINPAYQNKADDIVGKMTIKSLDDEMLALQRDPRSIPLQGLPPPQAARYPYCGHEPPNWREDENTRQVGKTGLD